MEFTLIAVTLLSLFLAVSMGVVAWRLVQEERQRSEARLAALAAELGRDDGRSANDDRDPSTPEAPIEPAAADGPTAVGGLFSSTAAPAAGRAGMVGAGRPQPPRGDRPASAVSGWTGMAGAQSPRGGRPASAAPGWAAAAALGGAAAVALVVATVFLLSTSDDGDAGMTEDIRPPLDLIALQHAEEGPFLDISGSVRNPADGDVVERLSVVAMAFDETGTLIATRRTPLENPALSAGAESAFLVRLLAAGVSRYRISFLLDDATIPHVDRRPIVQTPRPTGDPS